MAEWKSTVPKIEGWYWMRVGREDGERTVLPMRVREDGRVLATVAGGALTINAATFLGEWWTDPLVPPPEAPGNEG